MLPKLCLSPKLLRALFFKSVKLSGKNQIGAVLTLKAGHNIDVHNPSSAQTTLAVGATLAGFGKGAWKLEGKDHDINPELMPKFHLETSDDRVVYGNSYVPLKKVIDDKKKHDRHCKVMYHAMTDITGSPGDFSLSLDYEVYFAPSSIALDDSNGTMQVTFVYDL